METTRIIIDLNSTSNDDVKACIPEGHTVFDIRYVEGPIDREEPGWASCEMVAEVDHGIERDCWKE